MAISNSAFQFLQKLFGSWSGIVLAERDKYLIEARLLPLARQNRLPTVEELIGKLQGESARNGLGSVVLDALLPKETYFFRDIHPFELLRTQIFRAVEGNRFRECQITIWCAGCASGQEAYSVAMLLHRYFSHLLKWDVTLFGTDISGEALTRAQQGQFDEVEVHRGVQPLLIREYFQQRGARYAIKEDLSRLVQFSELNLMDDWPALPQADIVLMRNVLRYLNPDARKKILQKLKNVLRPDGCLFLGAQESAEAIDDSYSMVATEKTVYFQLSRNATGP